MTVILRIAVGVAVLLAGGAVVRAQTDAAPRETAGDEPRPPRAAAGSVEIPPAASEPELSFDPLELRTAVQEGLELVQRAAANYPKNRDCFSCHHQTLPMLAMVTARAQGFDIDAPLLAEQADFSWQTFEQKRESLLKGTGIGGKAMTVGYGLWALDLAEWPHDATTEAMAAYLLQTRREDGRWTMSSLRPPLEESTLMCTVISGYYLDRFATDAQRTEATLALDRAGHWLTEAARVSQEDFNARLWGTALWRSGEQADAIAAVRRDVLERQHADGGWSQLPELASDAYATGQTLFVLEASGFSTSSVEYVRGVRFLLDTRQPDGSWLVKTRSKPIQKFFDNGDPHGEHQFISTPATAWAVVALALAHRPGTEAAVKTPGSSVDRLPGERPPAIR